MSPPQTAAATSVATDQMAKATKTMASVGKVMQPQKMQQTVQEFSMAQGKMEMAGEMMGDAMDSVFEEEFEEEESAELMSQVRAGDICISVFVEHRGR